MGSLGEIAVPRFGFDLTGRPTYDMPGWVTPPDPSARQPSSRPVRMAAEQALQLMVDECGLSVDDAYSVASVTLDLGVTQVVDGTVGCYAALDSSLFA